MGQFFGRQHELKSLLRMTHKKSASMVVVTGRRRIGKSRLIEEFASRARGYRFIALSGLAPSDGVGSAEQRREFAHQLERSLAIPPIGYEDWGDLFTHLANHLKRGRFIVLLDEISWMGKKDKTFLPKLKNAWDLVFKKNPNLILVLCGSISSWIDQNILGHTGFVGRISIRLRLEDLPIGDCFKFWGNYGNRVSVYDKLKVLAVTGGVPRYLEEIIGNQTADETIRQLAFHKEGILFNEFEQIFSDLFDRRSAIYKRIVTLLVTHSLELSEIFDGLKMHRSGSISTYLSDLEQAGFIRRDYTWSLRTQKSASRSKFRLSDNYLRFYLKYVVPNRPAIVNNRFYKKALSTLPGFESIMGLAFENTLLNNREFIWEHCGIDTSDIVQDGPYFQAPTKRRHGCQIDYLVQTRPGPIYVCETKMKREPIGVDIIAEMQSKVQKLEIAKYTSVLPVLIHVGGVTDALFAHDYFVKIIDCSRSLVPSA